MTSKIMQIDYKSAVRSRQQNIQYSSYMGCQFIISISKFVVETQIIYIYIYIYIYYIYRLLVDNTFYHHHFISIFTHSHSELYTLYRFRILSC